eukprot:GHVQ01041494.1.p1 GENE.GHVQ01041494.1~~GHVQ01041494.1.p1  ORF type:complete len:509 (+),score=73.60 GHVQ01041494.1:456-1982(+)
MGHLYQIDMENPNSAGLDTISVPAPLTCLDNKADSFNMLSPVTSPQWDSTTLYQPNSHHQFDLPASSATPTYNGLLNHRYKATKYALAYKQMMTLDRLNLLNPPSISYSKWAGGKSIRLGANGRSLLLRKLREMYWDDPDHWGAKLLGNGLQVGNTFTNATVADLLEIANIMGPEAWDFAIKCAYCTDKVSLLNEIDNNNIKSTGKYYTIPSTLSSPQSDKYCTKTPSTFCSPPTCKYCNLPSCKYCTNTPSTFSSPPPCKYCNLPSCKYCTNTPSTFSSPPSCRYCTKTISTPLSPTSTRSKLFKSKRLKRSLIDSISTSTDVSTNKPPNAPHITGAFPVLPTNELVIHWSPQIRGADSSSSCAAVRQGGVQSVDAEHTEKLLHFIQPFHQWLYPGGDDMCFGKHERDGEDGRQDGKSLDEGAVSVCKQDVPMSEAALLTCSDMNVSEGRVYDAMSGQTVCNLEQGFQGEFGRKGGESRTDWREGGGGRGAGVPLSVLLTMMESSSE